VPALLVSRALPKSGVDHDQLDTTSILATIEHHFHLPPLHDGVTNKPTRDAHVDDLWGAFDRK
jgi:phospholipase C